MELNNKTSQANEKHGEIFENPHKFNRVIKLMGKLGKKIARLLFYSSVFAVASICGERSCESVANITITAEANDPINPYQLNFEVPESADQEVQKQYQQINTNSEISLSNFILLIQQSKFLATEDKDRIFLKLREILDNISKGHRMFMSQSCGNDELLQLAKQHLAQLNEAFITIESIINKAKRGEYFTIDSRSVEEVISELENAVKPSDTLQNGENDNKNELYRTQIEANLNRALIPYQSSDAFEKLSLDISRLTEKDLEDIAHAHNSGISRVFMYKIQYIIAKIYAKNHPHEQILEGFDKLDGDWGPCTKAGLKKALEDNQEQFEDIRDDDEKLDNFTAIKAHRNNIIHLFKLYKELYPDNPSTESFTLTRADADDPAIKFNKDGLRGAKIQTVGAKLRDPRYNFDLRKLDEDKEYGGIGREMYQRGYDVNPNVFDSYNRISEMLDQLLPPNTIEVKESLLATLLLESGIKDGYFSMGAFEEMGYFWAEDFSPRLASLAHQHSKEHWVDSLGPFQINASYGQKVVQDYAGKYYTYDQIADKLRESPEFSTIIALELFRENMETFRGIRRILL